jgi:hypothetical protein
MMSVKSTKNGGYSNCPSGVVKRPHRQLARRCCGEAPIPICEGIIEPEGVLLTVIISVVTRDRVDTEEIMAF